MKLAWFSILFCFNLYLVDLYLGNSFFIVISIPDFVAKDFAKKDKQQFQ